MEAVLIKNSKRLFQNELKQGVKMVLQDSTIVESVDQSSLG